KPDLGARPLAEQDAVAADGTTYDGSFVDGLRHGKGRLIAPDGFRYEGSWKLPDEPSASWMSARIRSGRL
ncbi:hypothetical protein VB636_13105, partial [Paracoccus sp. APAP_BH8]